MYCRALNGWIWPVPPTLAHSVTQSAYCQILEKQAAIKQK